MLFLTPLGRKFLQIHLLSFNQSIKSTLRCLFIDSSFFGTANLFRLELLSSYDYF